MKKLFILMMMILAAGCASEPGSEPRTRNKSFLSRDTAESASSSSMSQDPLQSSSAFSEIFMQPVELEAENAQLSGGAAGDDRPYRLFGHRLCGRISGGWCFDGVFR